jgi:D-lactate dehydrogenase (cytochrome)
MLLIKKEKEDILSYLEDSSNFKDGNAERVYIPENETELKEVLTDSAKKNIPITISGGGTGTVAGRVPKEGYIVSLEKFNQIININKEDKRATLQSGVIVKDFLQELDPLSMFYPPFPTERTAFIGGNAATNASGEYSFRFGATRKYIQKLRMVLTTGDILEIKRGDIKEKNGIIDYGSFKISLPSYRTPPIKCSAGYFSQENMDGLDLFIGSEGTLGVITEVEVSLIDSLPPRFIIIIFFPDEDKIPEMIRRVKRDFKDMYSLEFFERGSLKFLKKDYPEIPNDTCALYIETISGIEEIEKWAEFAEDYNSVDTLMGEDITNYERLIKFRHRLPENINAYFKKLGIVKVAMDISVPENNFEEMFRFYRKIMTQDPMQSILFGHIGENHLHFNLFPKDVQEKERAGQIYKNCVNKALSLGGTVAAEHGIGKIKKKWLGVMYGEEGLREMAKIKKVFDPYSILGLDNIIPKELLV